MSKGIPLSPKYGLNPTITKCFWCGEDMGIALLGKLKRDEEAPKYAVVDYNPCDKCKEKWSQGVVMMVVREHSENQPGITVGTETLYPTGDFLVVRTDGYNRIFKADKKSGDIVTVTQENYDKIMACGNDK